MLRSAHRSRPPVARPRWQVAACALLAAVAGCGGGGGAPSPDTTTLASALGTLERVALADGYVYVTERVGAGARILAAPLAGGAPTEVAATNGAIPSVAAYGSGVLYIDAAERNVCHAAVGATATVLNHSATAAPRAVATDGESAYWIDGAGTLIVGLSLPDDPGATDPPPPLSFPPIVAATDRATLLAVGGGVLWLADQGGVRLASVASTGGSPAAAATGLGATADLAASSTTVAACVSGGLYSGGSLTPLPSGAAVAAGVSAQGPLAASATAVYLREAGGLRRVLAAQGLADLDCAGSLVALAENASGAGRVRLLTLPATGS